jgi:hypothetical protein
MSCACYWVSNKSPLRQSCEFYAVKKKCPSAWKSGFWCLLHKYRNLKINVAEESKSKNCWHMKCNTEEMLHAGCRPDNQRSITRIWWDFSLLYSVQISSDIHPASYWGKCGQSVKLSWCFTNTILVKYRAIWMKKKKREREKTLKLELLSLGLFAVLNQ